MPLTAFAEYAADRHWVASHLLQLLGIAMIVAALVLLSRRMEDGPAAEWATLGMMGAVASLAVASALQSVDGVALKVMVDRWAAAAEPGKAALFQAALGVRQIERGLASIASMLMGLTVAIYGVALWIDHRFPRWLGGVAIVGGVPTAIAGVVIAYAGFSDLAMTMYLLPSSLLLVWMIVLGAAGWRKSMF